MISRNPLLALLALCALHTPALAEKTDIVTLNNGNILTCEIKEMRRGKMRVKTDGLATVYIEWLYVQYVESKTTFQIQLADGTYLFGALARGDEPGILRVLAVGGPIDTPMSTVSFIDPIESDFWSRIKGSVGAGLNYTKASDIAQTNWQVSPTYRTRTYQVGLNLNSIATIDNQGATTRRQSYTGNYTRFLPNRWFFMTGGGFESNDQLGLDLRSSLGAGLGRHLYQDNRSTLDLVAGVTVNHEDFGAGTGQENLEGLIRAEYSVFDFNRPIKDISLDLTLFPSFTDPGRLRAASNARVSWEIVRRLTLDLTFYADYDSGPDSGSLSTGDYGVLTSIGYSF